MLDPKPRVVRAVRRRAPDAGDVPLASVTVPCPRAEPVAFLDAFPGAPRVLVEDTETGVTLAGVGAARVIAADGADRFARVGDAARRGLANVRHDAPESAVAAGVRPRFVGGFAFFPDHAPQGHWDAFHGAWFALPRALLTATAEGAWITYTGPADATGLMRHATEAARVAESAALVPDAVGIPLGVGDTRVRTQWTARVGRVRDALHEGMARKAVIARSVSAPAPRGGIGATTVLARLADAHAARFLVEPRAGHAFVGATPETLITVDGRIARTEALAATAPRGRSRAEDDAFAAALLQSPKEREEHALVVDAVRTALAPFAEHVDVDRTPTPMHTATLQHLRTRIEARLRAPGHVLDIVQALHPTPAVGGAPTDAALKLVREAEDFERGWYAAPVGWFDADGNGTFSVAIRSALLAPDRVAAFAGAGILPDSDPQAEFDETCGKLAAMTAALAGGPGA